MCFDVIGAIITSNAYLHWNCTQVSFVLPRYLIHLLHHSIVTLEKTDRIGWHLTTKTTCGLLDILVHAVTFHYKRINAYNWMAIMACRSHSCNITSYYHHHADLLPTGIAHTNMLAKNNLLSVCPWLCQYYQSFVCNIFGYVFPAYLFFLKCFWKYT